MNIKEYIESGLLEAYVLGATSAEERAQVEADLAKYPEMAVEMAAIERTMLQYATNISTQPPANLQDKIWNTIQKETKKSKPSAGFQQNSTAPKTKVTPFEPEYRKPVQWKYAATIVALVSSLGANMLLWNEGKQQTAEKNAIATEINELIIEQQRLGLLLNDYQKAKNMMADTAMQTIVMHTMQAGHPMAATLYWNKTEGSAYVAMNALPAPPKGMQYQLWAIKEGKPVDMGILPNEMANSPAIQKIAMVITASEAFAISLEKEGGNPTPTLVYVMGKPS